MGDRRSKPTSFKPIIVSGVVKSNLRTSENVRSVFMSRFSPESEESVWPIFEVNRYTDSDTLDMLSTKN